VVEEARPEAVDSGVAPRSEGWFVVNVREAAWLANAAFGARCVFEANRHVVRRRPDLEVRTFPELGVTLDVIWPGQPSGLYHAETNQEDFLVLIGECLLLVEGEERPLRAWDFLHCPPGTAHVFVGAGDGPCVIFMNRPSHKRQGNRVPALRARPPPQRRRRDGDEFTRRGLRALPGVAARPSGTLERPALDPVRTTPR
jgi:uncharacterized cupin superfamily protein